MLRTSCCWHVIASASAHAGLLLVTGHTDMQTMWKRCAHLQVGVPCSRHSKAFPPVGLRIHWLHC
jgi:hypothetical protein